MISDRHTDVGDVAGVITRALRGGSTWSAIANTAKKMNRSFTDVVKATRGPYEICHIRGHCLGN
jgi:hypothetical protein